MIDISEEILNISFETRGETVRDSYISALNKLSQTNRLPDITVIDSGKMMMVNAAGEWILDNLV